MSLLQAYYRNPSVRARLLEFLGGEEPEKACARYITLNGTAGHYGGTPLHPGRLWDCLGGETEIARSLWDRDHVLAHLDLEYMNLDDESEPYGRVAESFRIQRPLVQALREWLLRLGIAPLHVLSGRGHHLIWQIRRESAVFQQLARLGSAPHTLRARYEQPLPPRDEPVGWSTGLAFHGLSLLLEHAGFEVLRKVSQQTEVPVTMTSVETISGRHQRESVVIDLSEYGDPLNTRMVRMPFSLYLKQRTAALGEGLASPLFLVPLQEINEQDGLLAMRDPGTMLDLARVASAQIPDQTAGTGRLLEDYLQAPLARVHRWFYAEEPADPADWPSTYDRTVLHVLPASGRRMLERPNPLLLKPACLRHITRLLLALGWHPRHIAGLIRSKYERNHGWGDTWYRYDAASRAEFYCRIYTSALLLRLDRLADFGVPPVALPELENCEPAQELEPFKESLLRRMEHDQFAHRPVHRLFP